MSPESDPVAGLRELIEAWDRGEDVGSATAIAALRAALLAEPVPPALAPLFHEALASTIDHLRARAYVVNHHLVVNFEDVYDALAARLTDPKGATDAT